MTLRDFLILVAICLVWAVNNVVSKVVVGMWHVPPLFYAGLRFAIVLLFTLPWLRPVPRPVWRVMLIGVLLGGGSFALMFIGLTTVSPSAAAVVSQSGIPITTLLSILLLGERIRWRRALGIALSLIGTLLVVWKPGFAVSTGMLYVLAASFAGALGAVLMKQMDVIAPLRFQAWVGMMGLVLLAPISVATELPQWHYAAAAGWPFVIAVLFSALIVSVVAHTAYFVLVQRYEANLLTPLTLITPLGTIALGVMFTGDQFDTQMIVGTGIALLGVLIVAVRRTGAPTSLAQEHS
ncbi:DMT family transporter [Novosphingobium sp. B 225]|uniref:DMT family transporter n=1 Tax=Novosphingobium sp. B 225 TaxID=1961849 RepID=UPI000B4B3BBD|nr:DMT family transporter [Novosphingobium sp. B 225]